MYTDFLGIKEKPFSITPDPRFLYMSKGHQEALAHLMFGILESGGFVVLTGEVGTGKTSICRCMLEQQPAEVEVALILNPVLTRLELLATICDEFGISYPSDNQSAKPLIDGLNRYLLKAHAKGKHCVLMIDEAQNLEPEVLEQVRLLTNLETEKKKLLQIILVGQPELNDLLRRRDMRQLNQRITARYHLAPLREEEVRAYIRHRLSVAGMKRSIFSPEALSAIFRASQGVPRLINIICDRALLAAYVAEQGYIDKKMALAAAREVLGPGARAEPAGYFARSRSWARPWPWATAAAPVGLDGRRGLLQPDQLRAPLPGGLGAPGRCHRTALWRAQSLRDVFAANRRGPPRHRGCRSARRLKAGRGREWDRRRQRRCHDDSHGALVPDVARGGPDGILIRRPRGG